MKIKKKFFVILFIITISIIYYSVSNLISNNSALKNIKSLISLEHKKLIMKYIFPYKVISQQELLISNSQKKNMEMDKEFSSFLAEMELMVKNSNINISTTKSRHVLSNNKILEKYKLNQGFYYGIHNLHPGSGYLDFYDDNMIILSSSGLLIYSENLDEKKFFTQIKNNLNDYLNYNDFTKLTRNRYSFKDLLIHKDKILISYLEEIKENCWNTSILYGNMNFDQIIFEKLFSSKDCILEKNTEKEFVPTQSGGRIVSYDTNHIIFSVGEYRNRFLAQDEKSINGKLIKININNSEYKIISMGHRNPQGLLFDEENRIILETEHGPMGGDEINLIDLNEINDNKIQNYGWPVVSAGEHYKGKTPENKEKYKKYPLYKSHSEYGFIEPLKSFVPSIAISEIAKIGKNKYVVSSMKDKSLYFFELGEKRKIINLERIELSERIRDLKYKDNNLYLFLENTASIGIINLS